MEVFDGNALEPTALLEQEEREVLQEALGGEEVLFAEELDELSRKRVGVRALDALLRRRRRVRADLEQTECGTVSEAEARLALMRTDRRLEMAVNVAAPVMTYEVENELKRAA